MKYVIIGLLLLGTPLLAGPAATAWQPGTSLTVSIGVQQVSIREFVLDKDYTVSRLDWEVEQLWQLGLLLQHPLPGRWTLQAALQAGIPRTGGTMDDYDWIWQDSSGALLYDGALSHHSWHDNRVTLDLEADLNFSYMLRPAPGIRIRPGAGIHYRCFSMAGSDGGAHYPSSISDPDSGWKNTTFSGDVITYRHHRFFPYLLLQLEFQPLPPWIISVQSAFSPWGFILAVDDHLMRTPPIRFLDYTHGFGRIHLQLEQKFLLSGRTACSLTLFLERIARMEGDSFSESNGTTYSLSTQGATDLKAYGISAGFSFRL